MIYPAAPSHSLQPMVNAMAKQPVIGATLFDTNSSPPDHNETASSPIDLHIDPESLVIDRSRGGSIAVAVLMASTVFLAGCGSEQELERQDYSNIQSSHEGNLP